MVVCRLVNKIDLLKAENGRLKDSNDILQDRSEFYKKERDMYKDQKNKLLRDLNESEMRIECDDSEEVDLKKENAELRLYIYELIRDKRGEK